MPSLTKNYIERLTEKASDKSFWRSYATLIGRVFWPDNIELKYTFDDTLIEGSSNNEKLKLQFAIESTTNVQVIMPEGNEVQLIKVPIAESGENFAIKAGDIHEGTPVAVNLYLLEPEAFPLVVGILPIRGAKKREVARRVDTFTSRTL